MSAFDALTLALEDWFATPLCELPDTLRQRVEKEFAPMPWDQLSADQRRTVTLQSDYQHDPATEQDRQFWWDHFWRQDELKAQIAQWEAAAAPTAGELALRETRLKELRQELARMAMRERQARGDYFPVRKPLDDESEALPTSQGSPVEYVAYPKAMAKLRTRLDATPEELAAWVWLGPKIGGLSAFVNANELDPPPRFHFGLGDGRGDDHDYVSPLMACWFRVDEIDRFEPTDRYVSGSALILRWSSQPGLKPLAFILAKIRESRLSDLHPIRGITQGSDPDDVSKPPVSDALFQLSDVKAIEVEDFAVDLQPGADSTSELEPRSQRASELQDEPAASEDRAAAAPWVDSKGDVADPAADKRPTLDPIKSADPEIGSPEWRSQIARTAANAKHDLPGGSRDKQGRMRSLWASGNYSSRDVCAEQECSALEMSFATARKALVNTPDPTRS